jgi:hypothetical protein
MAPGSSSTKKAGIKAWCPGHDGLVLSSIRRPTPRWSRRRGCDRARRGSSLPLGGRTTFGLRRGSGLPVPRRSPVVRKRKDPNRTGHFEVHDVVREPPHGRATDRQVVGHVWNWSSHMRPAGDERERVIDGFQELAAEAEALLLVPCGRLLEFGGGFALGAERKDHLGVRRRAARSRTSSQGSPEDSPARARRARLSISFAQAACTVARSSVVESSRLASNSAATSARSSGGNVSASRSSACARSVMWSL